MYVRSMYIVHGLYGHWRSLIKRFDKLLVKKKNLLPNMVLIAVSEPEVVPLAPGVHLDIHMMYFNLFMRL